MPLFRQSWTLRLRLQQMRAFLTLPPTPDTVAIWWHTTQTRKPLRICRQLRRRGSLTTQATAYFKAIKPPTTKPTMMRQTSGRPHLQAFLITQNSWSTTEILQRIQQKKLRKKNSRLQPPLASRTTQHTPNITVTRQATTPSFLWRQLRSWLLMQAFLTPQLTELLTEI